MSEITFSYTTHVPDVIERFVLGMPGANRSVDYVVLIEDTKLTTLAKLHAFGVPCYSCLRFI